MSPKEISTKERILELALDMFSLSGYNAVSIRDIAREVGIKESSIYHHFKSKEEILQSLYEQARNTGELMKSAFNRAFESIERVERDKFAVAGKAYLENFLLDKKIHRLLRLLNMEKQAGGTALELYKDLFYTIPLEHHEKIFQQMRERGFIKTEHPAFLALEYQALILFVFDKYFSGSIQEAALILPEAAKELIELLNRFYDRMIA